ncbi:MAG TPA: hypothetical protein PLO43_03500, partial [Chlamydiales bacterium]|nr:hypothetical protein [Chlamydiales bacterium]
TFAGVDCSGLLYEASYGLTPRNTSELISFGEERSLENLQPLDLLVWKGHVVIVLDPYHTIESRLGKGVVITPLADRLSEIERELATDLFVRRFF